MRKLLLLGLYWLVTVSALAFNTPGKINYQGVARSADGALLANQQLGIQIQIRTVDSNGDVVYSEVHTVITNQYGLFNLQIGDGSIESGVFTDVDWAANTFVELSIDFEGGTDYVSMGTSQLVSVPYALHSKTADNVFSGNFNDLINVPTNVSDFANDAGYITSADNTDSDATNEIQDLSLVGSTLKITNNAAATEINLAPFSGTNTDEQTLSLTGTNLFISNGNAVSLASIQDGFDPNTDTQLSEAEVDAFVANNGYLNAEVDGSTTNEIQDLSLTGSILKITNNASASAIDLASFAGANTDEQTLALSGTTLSISNGNNVNLSSVQDGIGTDSQTITLTGSTLAISGGNSINIASIDTDTQLSEAEVDAFVTNNGYLSTEVDGSTTNEIQDLVLTGSTLKITNNAGATDIDLSPFAGSNTDEQTLALSGTTLSISNGNNVNLSSVQDGTGTDSQTITLTGSNLAISGGNSINIASIDTDTQLSEAQVDTYAANNGYLTFEVDGSAVNELQTLAFSGTNLSISSKNTVDLSGIDTNTQLSEAEVDGFVANNGYLTSEVDGSATNELQTLALSGTNLSISGKNTVDLSSVQDGTGTDTQTLSISGSTLSISNGNSVALPGGGGTDDQIVDVFSLSGTTLSLSLESDAQANKTVNLSSLKSTVDFMSLTGSNLNFSLLGQAVFTTDLSTFKGPLNTNSTVTSNGYATNDPSYATNDFVFGSFKLDQGSTNYNSRMYFDKSKAAFRAGQASGTQWNSASAGDFSAAFGYNTTASSAYSFAAGNATIAAGAYSTALGYLTQATGDASTAFGQSSTATGLASFAAGASSNATGAYSTALGISSIASGNSSFAEGSNARSVGSSSIAMGSDVTATGTNSLTLGKKLNATQINSFVIGTGSSSTTTRLSNTQSNSFLVGFNATHSLMVQESKVTIYKVMNLLPQSSPPAAGVMGDLYVSTSGKLYFHNGTIWKEVSLL